jgi:predicted AlkP superfamily phosphohydrolase/phosphomutase
MDTKRKVIVIGLDGLEPTIVRTMLGRGELPHLARLAARGGFSCVRTTFPAQTPVAWSTFATGVNPGGHGIYDFIRRNPKTYLPDLALNRYEQKNAFMPPRAVNLRRGVPVWQLLSDAGIPSTVLRCPCTYPPDSFRGRMLSGMGVPDLRGGLGTSTYYSTADGLKPGESEQVVQVKVGTDGVISTSVIGPRNPRSGATLELPVTIRLDVTRKRVTVTSDGEPSTLEVPLGQWSDWLQIRFKAGLLQTVRGMVRFHLVALEPTFELYASPVNFDSDAPLFPISSPANYTQELTSKIGRFYTTGMVEDHAGLNNGRFDEAAYLDQCAQVLRERERMMLFELNRHKDGFFFCLFDTPDRLQHMFWRFREPDHPVNQTRRSDDFTRTIEDHYRECDAIIGRAIEAVDDHTLLIVLSDHGFGSFQRGLNLNTWLHRHGFLALKKGCEPGEEAGDLLKQVDWSQTRAYALGLGSIYVNIKGREGEGIVADTAVDEVKTAIVAGLAGLVDTERNHPAVRNVWRREQIYSGCYLDEAPDLVVGFERGYRVSWATALGGVPEPLFEDNLKKWSGDHIIDPELVPGVLFMNSAFRSGGHLVDLAPTILSALGVPKGPAMEGEALLA